METRLFSTLFLNTVCADREKEEAVFIPGSMDAEAGRSPLLFSGIRKMTKMLSSWLQKEEEQLITMEIWMRAHLYLKLTGVRWSVDPGNQSYGELEQLIGETYGISHRNHNAGHCLQKIISDTVH